jgi:hypothetical protein
LNAPESSIPTPSDSEHGIGAKLWNFFLVFLSYILIGPMMFAIVLLTIESRYSPDPAFFSKHLFFDIAVSYLLITPFAAAVGLGFAAWQSFVGRSSALAAVLSGVAIGLITLSFRSFHRLMTNVSFMSDLLTYLAICVALTFVPWFVTRLLVTGGKK